MYYLGKVPAIAQWYFLFTHNVIDAKNQSSMNVVASNTAQGGPGETSVNSNIDAGCCEHYERMLTQRRVFHHKQHKMLRFYPTRNPLSITYALNDIIRCLCTTSIGLYKACPPSFMQTLVTIYLDLREYQHQTFLTWDLLRNAVITPWVITSLLMGPVVRGTIAFGPF